MKTPEEIKKGMECCKPIWKDNRWKSCDAKCPYIKISGKNCMVQLFEDNHTYIQQLEANQPKWISVKDRLPPDLEEVLILVKETEFYGQYNEFSKNYFCQYIGSYDSGEWYTVWCHGHRYIKDTAAEPYSDKLEVTHWMPLPEMPKDIAKAGE